MYNQERMINTMEMLGITRQELSNKTTIKLQTLNNKIENKSSWTNIDLNKLNKAISKNLIMYIFYDEETC